MCRTRGHFASTATDPLDPPTPTPLALAPATLAPAHACPAHACPAHAWPTLAPPTLASDALMPVAGLVRTKFAVALPQAAAPNSMGPLCLGPWSKFVLCGGVRPRPPWFQSQADSTASQYAGELLNRALDIVNIGACPGVERTGCSRCSWNICRTSLRLRGILYANKLLTYTGMHSG
jgi:hypothetical protein